MIAFFDTVHEDTDLYSTPQVFRKLIPINPLQPGEKAPLFGVLRQRTLGQYIPWQADYAKTVHLHDWLQTGPLVVAFYSAGWNSYAKNYLRQLTQLGKRIQATGGTLLVVSPDSFDALQTLVEQQDLPFTVAQDVDNQIASKFGVYSIDDPIWNRIAGITEDVPFPSLFVVASDRQLQFSYVDKDFREDFPMNEVLNSTNEQKTVELGFYNRKAA